jgi:serine/threonine protein kinase
VAVDYFALGVVCYEFMFGKRPYGGKTRKDIRDSIIKNQILLKKSDVPEGWSLEAADFINKCLQRKPANRLGLNGPNEVKQHIWLKDVDWQAVIEMKLSPSFIPGRFCCTATIDIIEPRPPLTKQKEADKDEEGALGA